MPNRSDGMTLVNISHDTKECLVKLRGQMQAKDGKRHSDEEAISWLIQQFIDKRLAVYKKNYGKEAGPG